MSECCGGRQSSQRLHHKSFCSLCPHCCHCSSKSVELTESSHQLFFSHHQLYVAGGCHVVQEGEMETAMANVMAVQQAEHLAEEDEM